MEKNSSIWSYVYYNIKLNILQAYDQAGDCHPNLFHAKQKWSYCGGPNYFKTLMNVWLHLYSTC